MPFPNEHAARLKDPGKYIRFRRENDKLGPGVDAIWGVTKAGKAELQAIRFDAKKFTVAQARKWLKDHNHKPILFEPATGEKESKGMAKKKNKRAKGHRQFQTTHKGPKKLTFLANIELEAAGTDAEGKEKPKTFTGLAYTGGLMQIRGFYRPLVVDLTGVSHEKKIAVLKNHDNDQVVGHTAVKIDNEIRLNGVISGASDAAEEVKLSANRGFPWRLSIGFNIAANGMEYVPEKTRVKVNGRSFVGPITLVRKGELVEVSFVPVGADQKTSAKVAAAAAILAGGETMEFEKWLEAQGIEDFDGLDEKVQTTLRAAFDAEQKADTGTPDTDGDPDAKAKGKEDVKADADDDDQVKALGTKVDGLQAKLDETERVSKIKDLCADGHEEIQAKAIKEKWDARKTELEVVRASRPEAPFISTGDDGADTGQALEAAVSLSGGMDEKSLEKDLGKDADKVLTAAKKFQGAGLHALLFETIRAAGKHVRLGRVDDSVIRLALQCDTQLRAAGGLSTFSLSGVLGNVANKSLRKAFMAVDPVSMRIFGLTSVNNFQIHTRYSMVSTGELEEVPTSGQLKHGSFDEESHTVQAKTYGKLVGIGRQQFINDDLGAFLAIPMQLGRKSAVKREKLAFTLLLANAALVDGHNFFSAAHGNYLEGTGNVLAIAGLTNAEQLLAEQTDLAGDPIAVSGFLVLTGPALRVTAQQLFADLFVNETTSANIPKPNGNPHQGKYKPEMSPFLGAAAGVSGASNTKWHLFANPADVPVGELAFLKGVQTPVIEFSQADFDVLGMKWRAYYDIGVALAEYRGAVMSTGAASS